MSLTKVKRRVRAGLFIVVAGLIAVVVWLGVPRENRFVDRVGNIDVQADVVTQANGIVQHSVQLTSTTGLAVKMRVYRPVVQDDARLPVVLILGGQRTGRNAVDFIGEPRGIAYAAIDYPYEGPRSPKGLWASLRTLPHIRRGGFDTPAALALANSWLRAQDWADPGHIELVGISLGVPFAAIAGATDSRFSRIWLLHGGGDNVAWLSHAGQREIESEWLRRSIAASLLFVMSEASYDTPGWIARTAPRSVVIVSACNDDYVPREAQLSLEDAGSEAHVDFIWVDGKHIRTERSDVMLQLLDTVVLKIRDDVLPASQSC